MNRLIGAVTTLAHVAFTAGTAFHAVHFDELTALWHDTPESVDIRFLLDTMIPDSAWRLGDAARRVS